MICEPCTDGEHDFCDDRIRYAEYVKWLQSHPFGEDAVIGQAEMVIIKANRPYESCPCQHKGSSMIITDNFERSDGQIGIKWSAIK